MFKEKKTNLPVECISLSLILYASLTFLGKENSEKGLRTSISTDRCSSATVLGMVPLQLPVDLLHPARLPGTWFSNKVPVVWYSETMVPVLTIVIIFSHVIFKLVLLR